MVDDIVRINKFDDLLIMSAKEFMLADKGTLVISEENFLYLIRFLVTRGFIKYDTIKGAIDCVDE